MASLIDIPVAERPARKCDSRQSNHYGLDLTVDARKFTRTLLWIVGIIAVIGTIANSISHQVLASPEHKLVKLLNRFDIGYEPSVPNWYASMSLLFSSLLLSFIGWLKWKRSDRHVIYWLVLAALFLSLSIDEGVRFHEMVHELFLSQVDVHGIFYVSWVVPALISVGIVGLAYIPFLRSLDRPTALRIVAAGAVYVIGAVGMDLVGGVAAKQFGLESFAYTVTQLVEELLEMVGVVLFSYALLEHIRQFIGPVTVSIRPHSSQA